eukprot:CAMPEP_0116913418 /NCGR_PEP_ID=MMETSP0467-20121206/16693_1 /TAXON_ID=283647 /ORGANISM="Mesodinium pulex, Strain SPMC105" /LENGTH=80 /DNA_ID=CAMNT_0004589631 /DNA_START=1179 /DNA_END=1421 /DNA_ORIENTATION=+
MDILECGHNCRVEMILDRKIPGVKVKEITEIKRDIEMVENKNNLTLVVDHNHLELEPRLKQLNEVFKDIETTALYGIKPL